jgi:hypothetical protein
MRLGSGASSALQSSKRRHRIAVDAGIATPGAERQGQA